MSLEPQKTTALIGPSGCGKSTLLRILTGLLKPQSGRILLNGREVISYEWPALRKKIGYVIQDGGLFPHLSGRENVVLAAKYLGWSDPDLNKRCDELAELTQLTRDTLDRYPGELSGGQRQRVSLMRALFLSPEILFLDEPMRALDPFLRYELRAELKEIFDQTRITAVIVTHDLAEARSLGHQIHLLNEGCIVQSGVFSDFISRPADPFVSRFFRSAEESA